MEKSCRHCGVIPTPQPREEDWLCKVCNRFQDTAICPMCGSMCRASVLPEDALPARAEPRKWSIP